MLKVELVHQRRWATCEEAKRNVFAYIESYYNRQRIHSAVYITFNLQRHLISRRNVSSFKVEVIGR